MVFRDQPTICRHVRRGQRLDDRERIDAVEALLVLEARLRVRRIRRSEHGALDEPLQLLQTWIDGPVGAADELPAATGGERPAPRRSSRAPVDRLHGQSAASSWKSSRAVAIPSGTCSASSRSFGEWMFESGSPNPVTIVGMPLVGERRAPSAGSRRSGRTRAAPRPRARTRRGRAGSPSRRAGRARAATTTAARPRASLRRAPPRAGSARPPARSRPPSGPGRAGSRDSRPPPPGGPSSAGAASRSRTRSRRAPARRTSAGRTPRPRAGRPAGHPGARARRRPVGSCAHPASSASVGGMIPRRSGSASRPSRATIPEIVVHQCVRCVQRCTAVDARVEVARSRSAP